MELTTVIARLVGGGTYFSKGGVLKGHLVLRESVHTGRALLPGTNSVDKGATERVLQLGVNNVEVV